MQHDIELVEIVLGLEEAVTPFASPLTPDGNVIRAFSSLPAAITPS